MPWYFQQAHLSVFCLCPHFLLRFLLRYFSLNTRDGLSFFFSSFLTFFPPYVSPPLAPSTETKHILSCHKIFLFMHFLHGNTHLRRRNQDISAGTTYSFFIYDDSAFCCHVGDLALDRKLFSLQRWISRRRPYGETYADYYTMSIPCLAKTRPDSKLAQSGYTSSYLYTKDKHADILAQTTPWDVKLSVKRSLWE